MSEVTAAVADDAALATSLALAGHLLLQGETVRPLLEAHGSLADWPAFEASWNDMPVDTYMADGGRYRRRRYGVFTASSAGIVRQPHQAHYQSLDYNPLNGGVARWFEPITPAVAEGASLNTVLRFGHALFGRLAPAATRWQVEVHQFRIEAAAGESVRPTPEGVHRDGVDYVMVLLVRRHNIASGTTTVHAPDGRLLGSFTLSHPFDASLIDDRRVYHGVTPVQRLLAGEPAWRDVLVVTFRAEPAPAETAG